MRLYFIKAGDEVNNFDWFAWADTADHARELWLAEHGEDAARDLDRIWPLPVMPPKSPGLVDWPEPEFIANGSMPDEN